MLETAPCCILPNRYFSAAMYAVIDVETTGGSPSVDRVIEIAVFVFDGQNVVHSFSSLLNPKGQ